MKSCNKLSMQQHSPRFSEHFKQPAGGDVCERRRRRVKRAKRRGSGQNFASGSEQKISDPTYSWGSPKPFPFGFGGHRNRGWRAERATEGENPAAALFQSVPSGTPHFLPLHYYLLLSDAASSGGVRAPRPTDGFRYCRLGRMWVSAPTRREYKSPPGLLEPGGSAYKTYACASIHAFRAVRPASLMGKVC